jgi:L-lactate utilization protein LutC
MNQMNTLPKRRDRRSIMKFQGLFKKKNKKTFKDWLLFIQDNIKNGAEIFNTNKDVVEKSINEQLEKMELSMIEFWKDTGFNESEIEKLRESYAMSAVKFKDTRQEDSKVSRSLVKEAEVLKKERLNG